jgi:8-oxo-dGTP pyrophosphatase MutT (NUDIX family)
MPDEFVTVARAIVSLGNMLLVAQGPGEGFVHLPGGHVEAGEEPAELAATPDDAWTPTPELRRELAQAGLIDETTWAAYRRLLTRGLIAEY